MAVPRRAEALRDVVERMEIRAASSPYAGDRYYEIQEKARDRLLKAGYRFEWTGPYRGRLIPVRRSTRARAHVRRQSYSDRVMTAEEEATLREQTRYFYDKKRGRQPFG